MNRQYLKRRCFELNAMNIYWRLRNVPELASLAPADRVRVHEACLRRFFWNTPITKTSLSAYLVLLFCPIVFFLAGTWIVSMFVDAQPFWLCVLILVVGSMLGYFVFSRIAVTHLRQFYPDCIREELKRR